jgi:formylglycine-generating enzyme required for sulfatase activity/ADP-ribose pyrophosphatase YjhB (NUDIX family)/predicted transcriptional regulator
MSDNTVSKKNIVFLATHWGTKFGGINSFNIDLCRSVADILPDKFEIVCVVLNTEAEVAEEKKLSKVKLISLGLDDQKFRKGYADMVRRILYERQCKQIEWWIGHDAVTGLLALELRNIYNTHTLHAPQNQSQAAVIHHMDYEAYKIFQTKDGEGVWEQRQIQQSILEESDKVFAVGPYLEDSAKDLCDKEVIALVPGICDTVEGKPSPKHFRAITFGRFDRKTEILKQPELAIKSLGKAYKNHKENVGSTQIPRLILIGVNNDEYDSEKALGEAQKYAGVNIPIVGKSFIEDRNVLWRELSNCSVCMMLSLHEGFGLVGWEAITAEVPLILSQNTGLYQFLETLGGAATGCVCGVEITGNDEDDIESISFWLTRLLSNPEKYKKNSKVLKEHLIKEGYTWEGTAKKFLEGINIAPIIIREDKKTIDQKIQEKEKRIPKSPFKYLDNFTQKDFDIFFGREKEIDKFLKLIENSRLALLFGKSGAGKTSFLLAGIFPHLSTNNYIPIYVRCSDDPIQAIRDGLILNAEIKLDENVARRNHSLPELIHYLSAHLQERLVIVIDQFEEFFITLGEETRRFFLKTVKELFYKFDIDLKLVLIFREDFFVEFHELGEEIHEIFNNRFRLKELSKDMAIRCIYEPFKMVKISLQDGLIDTIVNQLASIDNLNTEKRLISEIIEPPQLQIVCHTLYEKLKEKQKEISIDDYIELGGARGILTDYVDYALEPFSYEYKEVAKEILMGMVSFRNTKVPLRKTEILDIGEKKNINEKELKSIIRNLVNRRLIVRKTDQEIECYELTHEYLIEKIKDWIDLDAYKAKEAQDMLRQEENHWKNYRLVMDISVYEAINNLKEKIVLDNSKTALMLRASIEHDMDVDYWTQKNINNHKAVENVRNALSSDIINVKRIACIVMLQFNIKDDERERIIDIFKDIGNPSVLDRVFQINKKYNTFNDKTIRRLRENIENRLLRNMVYVKKGKFIMGRDQEEIDHLIAKGAHESWFVGETPRRIESEDDFLIDKFLVTNEEYKEFDPGHTFPKGQESHPATNVSWIKANEYAKWLRKELPTEKQWEKAARGTDGRLFPWGNDWGVQKCNTRISGIAGTTEVDKYRDGVSPYGCYDMAGNVWEWTGTWKEKDQTVVVRGGSWTKFDILPWCSYRFDYNHNEGMQNVGFRCIRRIRNDLKNSIKIYSSGGVIFKREERLIKVLLGFSEGSSEWRLPKGMLKEGESVEECALREVLEETGYKTKIVGFIDFKNWSYEYDQKMWDETVFFFILKLEEPSASEEIDNEFELVKWFISDDAVEKLAYKSEKEILQKAIDLYKHLCK